MRCELYDVDTSVVVEEKEKEDKMEEEKEEEEDFSNPKLRIPSMKHPRSLSETGLLYFVRNDTVHSLDTYTPFLSYTLRELLGSQT